VLSGETRQSSYHPPVDDRDESARFAHPETGALWPLPLFSPALGVQAWLTVHRATHTLEMSLAVPPDDAFTLGRVTSRLDFAHHHNLCSGWLLLHPRNRTFDRDGFARFDPPPGPPLARVLAAASAQGGRVPRGLLVVVVQHVMHALVSGGGLSVPRLGEVLVGWDGTLVVTTDVWLLRRAGELDPVVADRLSLLGARQPPATSDEHARVELAAAVAQRLGLELPRTGLTRMDDLAADVAAIAYKTGLATPQDLGAFARAMLPETYARELELHEALAMGGLEPDLAALRQHAPPTHEIAPEERLLLDERARWWREAAAPAET